MVASLNGGEPRQLTRDPEGAGALCWSPDGKKIAFIRLVNKVKKPEETPESKNGPRVITDLYHKSDGSGFRDDKRRHIFIVDVKTGKEQQITRGDWHDDDPQWSPDGKTLAFISDRGSLRWTRFSRSAVWLVSSKGGRPRRLTSDNGVASAPRFSPNGQQIAYTGKKTGGTSSTNSYIIVVNVDGKSTPKSLTDHVDISAGNMLLNGSGLEWLPSGKSLVFLAHERGTIPVWICNVSTGQIHKLIEGDMQASALAITPDGRELVYIGTWSSNMPELYLSGISKPSPCRISDINTGLEEKLNLVPAKRISYKSSDNLEIEAFILYPPGYKKGRCYPLIASIHGGPHAYHPALHIPLEAQILAGAGYVVMLPNPRGSVSYGEKFSKAVLQDWGGGDYEDIIAGIDELISQKVVDPDRLFIEGYSYGGYMSAWAVTQTDRFRAAVSGAPVTDLVSAFGTDDITHASIESMGGSPFEILEEYYQRSPITHVKNVTTPVLLTHWEGDLRDPIAQSEQFFKGLKYLGKETEFVRYPGGSHGVRTPFQAVDLLRRTVDWFDRYDSDNTNKE